MFRCVFAAVLCAALVWPATAQISRPFPATALRGALQVTQPPEALLNGKPARLSPGARIRGADNLLQTSAAWAGQRLLVHYTQDPSGLVHDVWVLTPDEAARKPWPGNAAEAQRWEFNPSSQSWTRR